MENGEEKITATVLDSVSKRKISIQVIEQYECLFSRLSSLGFRSQLDEIYLFVKFTL